MKSIQNLNTSRKTSNFKLLCLCFAAILSAGCATVYNQATQKNEYVFINSMQEVQIGRSMAENIVMKKSLPLMDPVKQRYVNKIGNRIVSVCDRRDIIYHFMVLDEPDLNAFALPGGYIYIYKGLLEKVDEGGLAAILAHEVAHIASRHAVKRMQASLGYDLLLGLVLASVSKKDVEMFKEMTVVSDTVYSLLERGYSRQDEFFADKLAVKYLNLAGYDPQNMSRVLKLLDKESGPGGRVFETLSTHPRMQERIKKSSQEARLFGFDER